MRRRLIPELLDDDLGTPAEIAQSLADLRRINRWFGGTRTHVQLLRQVARAGGSRRLSLLEVGAGSGDVPLAAQRTLSREGILLQVTLLDRRGSHLPQERSSVAGDALRLPFGDGAFDVVSCSLLAHHFEPGVLGLFAREALRVCRSAVLINDLVRSPLHLALVYCGLPLFRSRVTRHDAIASVRRSYTREEMRQILGDVPAREVEMARHYLYRMGVIVWK